MTERIRRGLKGERVQGIHALALSHSLTLKLYCPMNDLCPTHEVVHL